ncbi:polyubiquitin-B [Acrasis kona]|uniref:Polyubiquitin-B n=1 Tax=Acrasis kona TaxID=1008807 RepID=A0AAW2ZD00_9EUKA
MYEVIWNIIVQLESESTPRMKVIIKHNVYENEYHFEVKTTDLIATLKEKWIQPTFQMEPNSYDLKFGNKVLEDDRTFKSYNIKAKSIILLLVKAAIPIAIKNLVGSPKSISVRVLPTDIIQNVMNKILTKVKNETYSTIPVLKLSGKKLDVTKSFEFYNIDEDSDLSLEEVNVKVIITSNIHECRSKIMEVDPSHSISDIILEGTKTSEEGDDCYHGEESIINTMWMYGNSVRLYTKGVLLESEDQHKTLNDLNITDDVILKQEFSRKRKAVAVASNSRAKKRAKKESKEEIESGEEEEKEEIPVKKQVKEEQGQVLLRVECKDANVFTICLMTESEWNEIKELTREYKKKKSPFEQLGGQSFEEILKQTVVINEVEKIMAFQQLTGGEPLGCNNVFEFIRHTLKNKS